MLSCHRIATSSLFHNFLFPFGGGFALAKMCSETGLSEVMGQTIGDWTKVRCEIFQHLFHNTI